MAKRLRDKDIEETARALFTAKNCDEIPVSEIAEKAGCTIRRVVHALDGSYEFGANVGYAVGGFSSRLPQRDWTYSWYKRPDASAKMSFADFESSTLVDIVMSRLNTVVSNNARGVNSVFELHARVLPYYTDLVVARETWPENATYADVISEIRRRKETAILWIRD